MTEEILNPKSLVLPSMPTGSRNLLIAEIGALIYDTTTGSLSVCNAEALGSWTNIGVN